MCVIWARQNGAKWKFFFWWFKTTLYSTLYMIRWFLNCFFSYCSIGMFKNHISLHSFTTGQGAKKELRHEYNVDFTGLFLIKKLWYQVYITSSLEVVHQHPSSMLKKCLYVYLCDQLRVRQKSVFWLCLSVIGSVRQMLQSLIWSHRLWMHDHLPS